MWEGTAVHITPWNLFWSAVMWFYFPQFILSVFLILAWITLPKKELKFLAASFTVILNHVDFCFYSLWDQGYMFTFSYTCDIKKRKCAFRIWIVFLPPSLPFYSAPLKKKINSAILIFWWFIYFSSFFRKGNLSIIWSWLQRHSFVVLSRIESGALFQIELNTLSLLGFLCLLFMLVIYSVSGWCFIMIFTCLKYGYLKFEIMFSASSVTITFCSISFPLLLLWLWGPNRHPLPLSDHSRSSILWHLLIRLNFTLLPRLFFNMQC